MNFSLRLKELREKKHLSQKQLAIELGVGVGSVGMWESSERIPPAKRLQTIANYFGVSVDYLLGRESIITEDDRAKGWVDSEMVRVIPIEAEMLEVFREVGAKRGKDAQKVLISVAKNMRD